MASADVPKPDAAATDAATENPPATESATDVAAEQRWPGWPGDCVFRLVVPVLKVGSIIGRKGDIVKKLSEETRARIRVLDGPATNADRIVLVSGIEEIEASMSPAMDAVMRIFKRISGLPESEGDDKAPGASSTAFCSLRLLVPTAQAVSLIGKQGSVIKSIQESSGASIRVLSGDEATVYATSEERVVEVQGEAFKVVKALEAVLGHLRKFLVDRTVLPLFEKNYNNVAVTQERQPEPWVRSSLQFGSSNDIPLSSKKDSLFLEREALREPQFPSSRLSLYGRDSGLSTIPSPVSARATGHMVTQIAQTMQIPLAYAEDIIGVGGAHIAYIRRTSNAILTVQESGGQQDTITVEIKGTSAQVSLAQQLIEEFISGHKEAVPSSYGKIDSGLRSSYSQLGSNPYQSSFGGHSYDGYGSSGLGGYGSYRM